MKKLIKMLTIILSFAFLASSCDKDTTKPKTITSNYFPNTVGDSWEYEVYDSSAFNGIPEYTVKVNITSTVKLIDGINANVWQYEYPWGNDTNYVRIIGDTVKTFSLTYSKTIEDLQFPRTIFLLPFKDENRWNGGLYGIDTFHVSSEGIIKTNFFIFDSCFKIYNHYLGPNLENKYEYWFRPNIGMIQIHFNKYSLGPTYRVLFQLKKYSLH
jgi:hypothetical protein